MGRVAVQAAPFDLASELSALTRGRHDVGGIGSFIGTVRDEAGGRKIVAMTLEHYPGMTEHALEAIVAEAEQRWPLLGVTVIHRVGRLVPGEGIVLVLAASAHRAAALAATGFLIDWLKTRAPFWKQEYYVDGTSAWVEAKDEDDAAALAWGAAPPTGR